MNQKYVYQAFPKVVYGPAGETKIIKTEEERPEGYFNYADCHVDGKFVGGEIQAEAAKKEASAAKKEAENAEKEYRAGIRAYLDTHGVKYAKNLSTQKLEELRLALDEHLSKQE